MNFPRLEGVISVDTETTGTSWKKDKLFGFAVAVPGKSWYYDIRETPGAIKWLHDACKQPSVKRVVNHNIKFDWHFLKEAGCELPPDRIECTMVRECLIDEHQHSYSLDSAAARRIGRQKHAEVYAKLAGLFGGKATRAAQIGNLHRAPPNVVKPYATDDAELALELWQWQEKEIASQELGEVWALERALTPVLIRMERRGVRVDVPKTKSALQAIGKRVQECQAAIDNVSGRKGFNANSPPQVKEFFRPESRDGTWWVDKVKLESTDSGGPSIGADALRQIDHPLAKAIVQYRKLDKARQFLVGHILGHEIDGWVYPNYNQTRGDNELGTGTGRLSINDPALQQIPARDEEVGSIVRACFIAPDDMDWVCFDWEQFEFRWFAHYANSEVLNEVYASNPDADFHRTVADLTGLPRSPRYAGDANAKQINLGLVFGMGDGKLAAEMGLPYEVVRSQRWGKDVLVPGSEAKEIFNHYHSAIPGIKELLQRASSIAKTRGYVKTAMGRHIRFPKGQFVHKAGGLVFQGTSADAMKLKLIELDAEGFDPMLSVHDETNFYMAPNSVKRMARVKEILEDFNTGALKCRIPIRAKGKAAKNWWAASKG